MTISKLNFIRKLGEVEKFFTSITRIGRYNNFSYIVAKQQTYSPEQIHYSLSQTIKSNPILASVVLKDSIYLPDSLKLNQVYSKWSNHIKLNELFSKINGIRFKYSEDSNLFQIVETDSHFAFTMDHSIFDGKSVMSLSKDFLSILNNAPASQNVNVPIYKFNPKDTISPPLETILHPNSTIPKRLTSDLPRFESGVYSYDLGKHHFQTKIIKKPSNLNMSLTTKIQTSWVKALIEMGFPKSVQYDTCFGVDSRRWIGELQDSSIRYGCYSTGYFQSIDPLNVDSQLYSDELRNDAKTGDILQPFMMYATSGLNWDEEFSKNYKEMHRGCLEITNIGKVEELDSWFVQSTFDLAFVFGINLVVSGDDLRFVFTMVDNEKIDLQKWSGIIDKFENFMINH